jgi:hypothetical protein
MALKLPEILILSKKLHIIYTTVYLKRQKAHRIHFRNVLMPEKLRYESFIMPYRFIKK